MRKQHIFLFITTNVRMRYKLFMLDVGLLGALSELPATSILEGNDIFMEFKGALTEQYVLQQLISDTPYAPYYYGTEKAVRFSTLKYMDQEWMVNIPLYAVCNL